MAKEPLKVLTESMFYVLLSLLRQERCGTEIVQYVDDATAGRVPLGPGTLYTILAKFQEEGLIRETAVEGRKRTYAITDRGRALFRQELSRLRLCVGRRRAGGAGGGTPAAGAERGGTDMKDHKRFLAPMDLWDVGTIEAWLEEKAAQGWILEKWGSHPRFERIEPRPCRVRLDPAEPADPGGAGGGGRPVPGHGLAPGLSPGGRLSGLLLLRPQRPRTCTQTPPARPGPGRSC